MRKRRALARLFCLCRMVLKSHFPMFTLAPISANFSLMEHRVVEWSGVEWSAIHRQPHSGPNILFVT